MKVGLGSDFHMFNLDAGDGPHEIMLCGKSFESPYPVDAHSDGDVPLHAVVDAILGAAGLDDIGSHFPPSDDRWKGCDSGSFVSEACRMAREKGLVVSNINIIISMDPRVVSFVDSRVPLKSSVARLLGIHIDDVNVQGKSGNGSSGDVGQGLGISSYAVVLLKHLQD